MIRSSANKPRGRLGSGSGWFRIRLGIASSSSRVLVGAKRGCTYVCEQARCIPSTVGSRVFVGGQPLGTGLLTSGNRRTFLNLIGLLGAWEPVGTRDLLTARVTKPGYCNGFITCTFPNVVF